MTHPLSFHSYEFSNATDLGRKLGGKCFSPDGLPVSLARFEFGSHESRASSTNNHLLCLTRQSDGWLETEVGGVKGAYATSPHKLIYAPCSAQQA